LIKKSSSQKLLQYFQLDFFTLEMALAKADKIYLTFSWRWEQRWKLRVSTRKIDLNNVTDLCSKFMDFLHRLVKKNQSP
jgi:hypothetical protein